MSIIQSGQNKTDVLNGKVRIEDGNQRLIAESDDGTTIILGKNKTGEYAISYYDTNGKKTSVSTGGSVTYYNTDGDVVAINDNTKTVYYDSAGDARILIGKAPDGTTGFWISIEGEDVIDALGE